MHTPPRLFSGVAATQAQDHHTSSRKTQRSRIRQDQLRGLTAIGSMSLFDTFTSKVSLLTNGKDVVNFKHAAPSPWLESIPLSVSYFGQSRLFNHLEVTEGACK